MKQVANLLTIIIFLPMLPITPLNFLAGEPHFRYIYLVGYINV